MNLGASALHPTSRDSDGGPLVVDEDLGTGFPGMRYHAGMTASERVACGRGTAEDLAACEARNAAWREWRRQMDENTVSEWNRFAGCLGSIMPAPANVAASIKRLQERSRGSAETSDQSWSAKKLGSKYEVT